MTTDEKSAAFDLIANRYYHHNFGQMAKADFEVLLFSIFLDDRKKYGESCDDYSLAVELGITEAKVRSLKVRKHLYYPPDSYDWKDEFLHCIQNATYDETKALVKVSIVDPNLRRCVEAHIDSLCLYIEYQLNTKLLQMRPDHFVLLVSNLYADCKEHESLPSNMLSEVKRRLIASAEAGKLKDETIIDIIHEEGLENCWQKILKKCSKAVLHDFLESIPFNISNTKNILSPLLDRLFSAKS